MPKHKKTTTVISPEARAYLAQIGRNGGTIGGKVTASRMTPEQRSERARKAGTQRAINAAKKSGKIPVDTSTNAG